MENYQIIHLAQRFGFGVSSRELATFKSHGSVKGLLSQPLSLVKKIDLSSLPFSREEIRKGNSEQRRKIAEWSRKEMGNLNVSWVKSMIKSDNPLMEKINLFWHHHFACEIKNPVFAIHFSNHIRSHSVGNFRELLIGIAKSPAIIAYLNTRQNKKQSPNEDFARELCELFTLGVDRGYDENDVKEIARSFTGWSHNFKGEYMFRKRLHDFGEKNIFGRKGNFSGEEVIDLILEKRECATFIAGNVFEYFVNASPDQNSIQELADILYDSDYDLKKMFQHLIAAPWFYEDQHIMAKVKSPLEFLVGLGRLFQLESDNELSYMVYQRIFNQNLYRPPNVAGWKVDKEWIDSNSLSLRLRIPSVVLAQEKIDLPLRPELDESPMMEKRKQEGLKAIQNFKADWQYFNKNNEEEDLLENLFNNRLSSIAVNTIEKIRNRPFKQKVIQLFSIPEYQLC
jgi:uncharacterized protein (DUF1800 family)